MPRAVRGAVLASATLATALVPRSGAAQEPPAPARTPLDVTTTLDGARPIASDAPIEFTLNRAPDPEDGVLVLLVGGVDVTALAERSGERLTYRPTVARHPAGDTEVALYANRGGRWTELRRTTVRVLHAGGFRRATVDAASMLGSKGQVAEGRSETIPEPDRATYQDLVLNGSLSTTHERARLTIETSSNFLGVSRREEALRFGTEQDEAPRFDLSDYRITLRAGPGALTLGHANFGTSRHLVNGFGSRGATLTLGRGPTQLSLGALNGAPLVGWDYLLGFNQSQHRILGASLGREILPKRPGGLRLDATVLDASVKPINGFRQGAVLDAEQSLGGAVNVTASTPGQRLRLSGGWSRSRFDNPQTDTELTGDTTVTTVQRETRSARYVEGGVQLLQQKPVKGLGTISLGLNAQHERVDPLYRSVPTSLQADLRRNAADATFGIAGINGQLTWAETRDNLAELATLPTTLGDTRGLNLAIPVAGIVRAKDDAARWWPMLTLALTRVHQYAEGTPTGGVYNPVDLPDQVSENRDVGAQWQVGRWRLGLRHNRASQDNRQAGREQADFSTGADAVSVGTALGSFGDIALDIGEEFQLAEQRDERTETQRATMNLNLRRGQSTSMVLALSLLRTTPPTGPASVNGEQRVELMQPLLFLRDASGAARGQLFLRYGRSTAKLPDFANLATDPMARVSQQQWTLSSGLNFRMF